MANIYTSVEQLIGRTPLLKLTKIEKEYALDASILAKLEAFNPAGSVKDRVAIAMLEKAKADGILKEDSIIVEPTSGNTGIGLAAVAAAMGYKMIVVMPASMSKERQILMKAYGAELVLTDGALGMAGAIEKANEIVRSRPCAILAGQFTNPANPYAHYNTTGPEIWEDTDGAVDILVCGVGTGGTVSGTGRYLKDKNPSVKVIGVEPYDSAVLSGKAAGAHKLQGIGAGFIPETLDETVLDEVIPVTAEQAYTMARKMGQTEGFLIGISGGAALFAATEIAKRPENKGKNIIVILPDGGDRYLSTDLFEES